MVDVTSQMSVQTAAAAKPPARRYYVLGLLTIIYALNFRDRTIFNVLIEPIKKEFALSGSEQNPDFTNKDLRLLARRLGPGATGTVEMLKERGADFVVAGTVDELLIGMRDLDTYRDLDLDRARAEL